MIKFLVGWIIIVLGIGYLSSIYTNGHFKSFCYFVCYLHEPTNQPNQKTNQPLCS